MLSLNSLSIAGLFTASAVFAQTSTGIKVASLQAGASCACTKLVATYGELVLSSYSLNYTTETIDYWDIRDDLKPGCIFLPTEATQVASAVDIFTSCGAQFAIRGGGHMNFPGSNNIDEGVLLAFNNMAETVVASDNKTIDVGPGARWVDVYSALAPYDLYTIGGRLKVIGVSGLELIGGFHYLINKYGFAMDLVSSYDVVLGNGTQVVANAASNPDLFWALKGGANNFGIVTKYTISTLPIPLISTTIQTFTEADVPAWMAAAIDNVVYDDGSIAAGSVLSIGYNITSGVVAPSLLGVQEGSESPPSHFANFTAIGPISNITRVMKPIDWHNQLESPNQMFRVQFGHKTLKAAAAGATDQLLKIYTAWKAAVDEISDVEGLYPTFVLNTVPRTAMSVAKNNGVGNTWGLDDTEGLMIWQISTGWANAADDLRMSNWAQGFIEYWHSENQALGMASEFIYMGDAGEYQKPFLGFPLENVQRMRAIRKEYDSLGVFSRLNWGGFKLGN